jgi:aryl-alcohol dehydrogenase-like predicted oxidoreductase
VLGLGCNNFGLLCDAPRSRAIVDAALEAGVTLFDTGPAYGQPRGASEEFLGLALKGRRQAVVVSTKVGSFSMRTPGLAPGSRLNIRQGIEGSLRRLNTDYVDLLYLHQPDLETPIEETLGAMDELVREGKVRYLGCANFPAWHVVEAEMVARCRGARFIAAQHAYSLVDRMVELDVAVVCARFGIGLVSYFPLANGLLTGRYRRGDVAPPGSRLAIRSGVLQDDRALAGLEALQQFATQRDLSLLQVALGGLAAKRAVASVVAGASAPEQVRINARAIDWVPDLDDAGVLDGIAPPAKYIPVGSRTGYLR